MTSPGRLCHGTGSAEVPFIDPAGREEPKDAGPPTSPHETMNPIERILRHFEYQHLPPHLQEVSKPLCDLAHALAVVLPGDPETTAGLRKLLEAKDCFVRAKLSGGQA